MSSTNLRKNVYRVFLNAAAGIFGAEAAKKVDARFRFRRVLNLDEPKTLADKVSWIELNTDRELAARCTDKFAVRGYVESKGFRDILVPLCGGPWTSVDEIDVDALPQSFVLKATHGCEMNYICKNKEQLDASDLLAHARRWLKVDYPRACVEPHYKLISHRLYAESYIGGIEGGVIDYKFHCLNGEPSFILACSDRENGVKLNLYDLSWAPIDGVKGPHKNNHGIPRPSMLEDMINVARGLSRGFDFVRVDLYEVDGMIYFGELTFSPASGVFPNFTDEFVAYWGERLSVCGLD